MLVLTAGVLQPVTELKMCPSEPAGTRGHILSAWVEETEIGYGASPPSCHPIPTYPKREQRNHLVSFFFCFKELRIVREAQAS